MARNTGRWVGGLWRGFRVRIPVHARIPLLPTGFRYMELCRQPEIDSSTPVIRIPSAKLVRYRFEDFEGAIRCGYKHVRHLHNINERHHSAHHQQQPNDPIVQAERRQLLGFAYVAVMHHARSSMGFWRLGLALLRPTDAAVIRIL